MKAVYRPSAFTRETKNDNVVLTIYKKSGYGISAEIINRKDVTKALVVDLFNYAPPRDSQSMHLLIEKCSDNKTINGAEVLLKGLIERARAFGECWNEMVCQTDPRDTIVSRVLTKVFSYYSYDKYILEQFINADTITLGDIQFFIRKQFNAEAGTDKIVQVISCLNGKYPLNQLFATSAIVDIASLAEGRYSGLQAELLDIILTPDAQPSSDSAASASLESIIETQEGPEVVGCVGPTAD